MEEYPLLNKAPITEAVIDLQIKLPIGFEVKKIDSLYESFKGQYPKKEELRKFDGRVEFKREEQTFTPISEQIGGYRFSSADGKQIVQLRIDGFTFSRLTPYIDWKHLRNEAHRLWQIYKSVTDPLITRVALRYINKINIPMPIRDFADFLTAPPIVPEALPQGVSSFLTRVVIPEPYIPANAVITQVLEPIIKPDFIPIILDIDVNNSKPEGIEEHEAWELLEKFRHFKNKIFFNSISEKLKEMLK